MSGDPATTDPNAHDQPGFSMPTEHEGGRITEFKGEDKFKLGVGVKKGDATHMLKAHDWSVPWAIQVGKDLNGAGKAIASSQVQDPLRDGPDASLKNWSLEKGSGQVWEGFATQEEAMQRTRASSWTGCSSPRTTTPSPTGTSAPRWTPRPRASSVTINCDTTDSNFTDDVLSASVLRDGALVKSEGGIKMNNGNDHTVSVGWAEVFGSAANIKGGMVLKVELYVTAESFEVGHGFMPPFKGTSPMLTPRDGRYTISVSY